MNIKKRWFISLISLVFVSCIFIKKQEIKVENAHLIPAKKTIDSARLKFSYDLKFKEYIKQNASYQISYQLLHNSKVVCSSTKPHKIKFYERENSWDSTFSNNIIDIPISDIKLNNGKYNVELVLTAIGDNLKKATIYRKELVVDIPELFDYKEQNVTILEYTNNIKKETIFLNYKFNFQIKNYQIKGVAIDKSLQTYYLKILFYDKATKKPIQLISNKYSSNKFNTAKINNKQCEYKIPFIYFKLKPGKHEIVYQLVLSTKKDEHFRICDEGELQINVPQYYNVNFNLKSLELINKRKYDPTSIVGQIFSRKKKKRGLGYPDLYWNIYADKEKKYQSKTIDNAYVCRPAEIGFLIKDNQTLKFGVWDEDGLTNSDFVGQFIIPNEKGEFNLNFNKKTFGNVKCDLSIEKIKYEPWNE